MKTKKCAIYLRVSTTAQTTDSQKSDLLTFCERRSFEVFGVYEDIGISGATEKRPSLDKLMDDARKGKFDVVLVWRFDRFARSVKHLLLALEEFSEIGVDFVSYQESIDTTTPLGKALFTICSAVSALERDIIKSRVRAGLANALSKGRVLGRPRKIDYGRVATMRDAGMSMNQIAKSLRVSKLTVSEAVRKTLAKKGVLSS